MYTLFDIVAWPTRKKNRLIDEGYTAGDAATQTPTQRVVQHIVETMTLKELSEKITGEYIKVHELNPII